MKNILIVDDIKGWRDYHISIVKELLGDDVNIQTADSATAAYNTLFEQDPLDIIITDLQMEDDYSPKFAGEWFVEQIKTFTCYQNTKVVIISASYNAKHIAETLGVECIQKATALKCIAAYKEVFGLNI